MTDEKAKRKLTAILSADVKGYSRLMADDEESTVRTINAYREVMTGLIAEHHGRVVDAKGDNVLAEFASVVDAVRCSVDIQRELKKRNADLATHRKMEFRIGVNLGDVIEEKETIYGDGVNVAARLEGLADAGGVCISGTAFDQVRDKLNLGYEYLGEQSVKNIPRPIRAYKVLMEKEHAGKVIGEEKPQPKQWRWAGIGAVAILIIVAGILAIWNFYLRPDVEPASVEKMAFPLPDKPSIAVLPFVNMSGDTEQDYFSDGLTDQIITGLSKIPSLFVIARNSTFVYKGKPVKISQVSEELGVKYVLEGSVQKSKDRIRITAQLIDATKGHHLWAETYDRNLTDIFALQDEIMRKIMEAMAVKLTLGEQARVWRKVSTENIQALEKLMQGVHYLRRATKHDNAQARKLFEEALALDQEYLGAYILLAMSHLHDAWFRWSASPRHSMVKAFKLGQKVLAKDTTYSLAHSLIGQIYLVKRDYEKAIAKGEKAIALDPNAADAYARLGYTLTCAGRHEEAIESLERAIRLNPFPPAWYLQYLGISYRNAGRCKEAIVEFKKALYRNPDYLYPYTGLASCYILLGREDEARGEVEKLLEKSPTFSLTQVAKTLLYKQPSDRDLIITVLRKAGLPETAPLPLPDKPSIAVLPFTNMSGDTEQEYFSDGITEEIITALSKTPKLFVIARNSIFTYKGKPTKVQQVGRELGVKYVLEGSVRKSGNKVRITAQLVDAQTGSHLWAERYDRDLKDIFAIQDEITKKIITALQIELTEGEQALVYARGTKNLEAYLKVLQAAEVGRHLNQEDNLTARRMVEEAIALDPNYASAYRELGATHMREVWLRIAKSPRDSLKRAAKLAKKALALDESLPPAHTVLGQVYLLSGAFDKAISEGQRVIEIDPNGAESHWFLGMALVFSGRPQEGLQSLEKAIRLNPFAPSHYFHIRALAHWYLEQHDEAIEWGEKAVKRTPQDQLSHAVLTMSYSSAGREEEARAQAAELRKINPRYCVKRGGKDRFKDPEVNERFRNELRRAGVPDCPLH